MAVPLSPTHHEVPHFDLSAMLKAKMSRPDSPNSSDKTARSSFSSVRENDDGLAQTFTRSKISSYTQGTEEVFDESPTAEIAQPSFQAPLTQPHSRLHGFWYPADSFRGWKQIPIKGKAASRSCEDLHKLSMTWSSPAPIVTKPIDHYATGASPMERLPSEVLGAIIDLLVIEIPPNGLTTRNADLMALLLTSRSIHAATLNTLYRHVTIPHSRIFRKFLNTVSEYPALASIVRRMDFSHFNPSTIFSTASERAQTRNLTSETLLQCLELTPYLQEFLAQEYIDEDLGPDVLKKLFFGMPRLQAVDFCGCASPYFKNSFQSLMQNEWPQTLTLTRVSFHKCLSLPASVYEMILPRLSRVTHLDLAGTRVTDQALMSIPKTARITHLNLAKCRELTSETVVKFITTHPAVTQSLVVLSLATIASSHLLLGKADVDAILPRLPSTLRSLSLKGSRMDPSQIPLLTPLVQQLEELAIGRGLELGDIHKLLYQNQKWIAHSLRYLDISDIDTIIGSANALLGPGSAPLHVIELEERAYERAAKVKKNLERVGWTAKEFGSRYWLVRMNSDGTTRDNGARWFEDLPTTPPVSKRIRCSSSSPVRFSPPRSISASPSQSQSTASQASVLDHLRAIFPDMDKQFLEKALEECGNDLDSTIKSLYELRLGSAENNLGFGAGTSDVGLETKVQLQSQGVAATNGEVVSSEDPSAPKNLSMDGAEWVELFVREMMSASNMDDARARASRALEVLEKSICARASAEAAQSFHQENLMLKEQVEALLQENIILKRAVSIQHERQKESEERNQELQHLKQVVTQYQEQLRTLEVNNYALSMHLRQAQQSSSIPGHFHPDVF